MTYSPVGSNSAPFVPPTNHGLLGDVMAQVHQMQRPRVGRKGVGDVHVYIDYYLTEKTNEILKYIHIFSRGKIKDNPPNIADSGTGSSLAPIHTKNRRINNN